MLYQDQFHYLGLIVLMPLLGALINGILGAKLPKKLVDFIACGAILSSFFFSLLSIRALVENAVHVTNDKGEVISTTYGHLSYTAYQWIYAGDFGVDLAFMLDPLTALLLLLITGVGFLIHLYSTGYMADDPSKWRYFSYLNLFCFAMLLLVLGKNMLVTFIGWEGVGLCSYLLIGFWYTDDEKAKAGQKAFIVNRVGDFAFLVGMFILYYETQTLDYLALREFGTNPVLIQQIAPVAGVIVAFIFIGCTGKSAQIPLYVWLPDAMAGPTPVSALIHAATMVTSGVFLLSRLNWLVTISFEVMAIIAWVGALTAFFAATIAITQNDIKKVLAYSTVSQLGYMFLAVGVGSFTAAVFHLMTHAFFKALMFLGSGSVIHAMHHEQDMRKMGGLGKYMPWTSKTFFVGCLAISGVPVFSGFFSKDAILWGALSNTHILAVDGAADAIKAVDVAPGAPSALAQTLTTRPLEIITSGSGVDIHWLMQITSWGTFLLAVITAGMTAFYMFRLYFMTFSGECRADEHTKSHLHESPPSMVVPLVVLAILSAVGGLTGWPHFIVHYAHFLPEGFVLFFEHWFAEIFATSNDLRILSRFGAHAYAWEMVATVCGMLAAGLGIGLSWKKYYGKNFEVSDEENTNKLYDFVSKKYKVDELYDFVFVRGSIKSGEGMTFFDKHILDGVLVNGTAVLMSTAGRILRHLQSGNVQRYATYVTLGIVLALVALMLRM